MGLQLAWGYSSQCAIAVCFWIWGARWGKHLFSERHGESVYLDHHPKRNIIRLQADASIRLRLPTEKPDERGVGDVVLGGEFSVLLDVNLSKHDGGVEADLLNDLRGIGELW